MVEAGGFRIHPEPLPLGRLSTRHQGQRLIEGEGYRDDPSRLPSVGVRQHRISDLVMAHVGVGVGTLTVQEKETNVGSTLESESPHLASEAGAEGRVWRIFSEPYAMLIPWVRAAG